MTLASNSKAAGQIITFYSYKGGTGRSMALANVGYILAGDRINAPRGVLLIDWDLEAPGLHRYFGTPTKGAGRAEPEAGLIEFLESADKAYLSQGSVLEVAQSNEDQFSQRRGAIFEHLGKYLSATDVDNLYLMRAGGLGDDYAERIRRFDWERFHHRDPRFFAGFRRELATRFSYVLVDSRTGLTDTSGICARQMPDKLVLVFVPNRQNIDGVIDVARKVKSYQVADSLDPRAVAIFPLASRIDGDASALRDTWRKGGAIEDQPIAGYQPTFEKLLTDLYELDECNLTGYFDETQVPHDRDYAYGERVAAKRGLTDRLSLGFAYANFTRRLTTLAGPWEVLPEERLLEDARKREAEAQQAVQAAQAAAARTRRRVRNALAVAAGFVLLVAAAATAFVLGYVPGSRTELGIDSGDSVEPRQRFVGQTNLTASRFVNFEVPPGPRDYYELSVLSDTLRMHATGPGFNAGAGEYGGVLTTQFTAEPKSVVEIELSGESRSLSRDVGRFDLVINPMGAFDAYEPNDSILSARRVDLAQSLSANIMDRSDVDYYSLELNHTPSTVSVENRTTTLWPYVTVFSTDRVVVANAQGEKPGASVTLAIPSTVKGLIYLAVEGRNFTAGDYTLTLR